MNNNELIKNIKEQLDTLKDVSEQEHTFIDTYFKRLEQVLLLNDTLTLTNEFNALRSAENENKEWLANVGEEVKGGIEKKIQDYVSTLENQKNTLLTFLQLINGPKKQS